MKFIYIMIIVFILIACNSNNDGKTDNSTRETAVHLPIDEQIPGNCVSGNAYAVMSFSGSSSSPDLFTGENFGDLTLEWFVIGADFHSEPISQEEAHNIGKSIFEEQFFSEFSLQVPIRTSEQVADLFFLYSTPLDFGGAAFIDSRSGQVLFAGSIVWSGRGQLLIPSNRLSADEGFLIQDSRASDPDELIFLESEFWNNWSGEEGEANRAWQLVRQTNLVKSFSKCSNYKVVIWPYTPSVGELNPQAARIIVIVTGQSTDTWISTES